MLPKNGWKPIASAPRDGTIIMVLFNGWNRPTEPEAVGAAHWFCDDKGHNWGWKHPWCTGRVQHAKSWMTMAEFYAAAQSDEKPEPEPEPVEFDL